MEYAVVCSWDLDPASEVVPQFKATDSSPCDIRCSSRQPIGAVHIHSSARICELRSADEAEAYIATVRGVQQSAGNYILRVDVQVNESSPSLLYKEMMTPFVDVKSWMGSASMPFAGLLWLPNPKA